MPQVTAMEAAVVMLRPVVAVTNRSMAGKLDMARCP
jgi:hypothetical protein